MAKLVRLGFAAVILLSGTPTLHAIELFGFSFDSAAPSDPPNYLFCLNAGVTFYLSDRVHEYRYSASVRNGKSCRLSSPVEARVILLWDMYNGSDVRIADGKSCRNASSCEVRVDQQEKLGPACFKASAHVSVPDEPSEYYVMKAEVCGG
ncbi:hypothetical protein [Bauldia sp.]|uniref:hypothetical protein n=1 Tax=Bauldia sp. TaxID=2575872 RepID=UPI003BADAAA2